MNSVTVNKVELIETLKENRSKHREIFESAQRGYRDLVIWHLDNNLKDARDGKEIRTRVNLQAPIDQTSDYDRVIRMLEMSVDTEIELSEHDFAQYVLDDWSWKNQFITVNTSYLAQ